MRRREGLCMMRGWGRFMIGREVDGGCDLPLRAEYGWGSWGSLGT